MELNGIIDALYARYQEKQPDSMQYVFPPPAAPEEIAAAETALGMRLPDELRALYARHGYMMDAWDGVSIEPVQSIAASRQSLENVASDMAAEAAQEEEPNPEPFVTARGPVAPLIYAPARIPFASQNCMDLLIDLQPPPDGTPGQIVRLDIEDGTIEVVASSLTAFFAQGLEIFSKEDTRQPGALRRLGERMLGARGPARGAGDNGGLGAGGTRPHRLERGLHRGGEPRGHAAPQAVAARPRYPATSCARASISSGASA